MAVPLRFLLLAALAGVATSSTLTLVSPVPSSISVTEGKAIAGEKIAELNSAILGLSSSELPVETSLFAQPKALVVLELLGLSGEVEVSGSDIALTGRAAPWERAVQKQLTEFADSAVLLSSVGTKLVGDEEMKREISEQKVDSSKLKSKGDVEAELTAALRVASAIKDNAERLSKKSGPAVFHVEILHADQAAPSDLTYVLNQLSAATRAAYGENNVVIELIQWEKEIARRKRADDKDGPVMAARKKYNVSVFSAVDYPATFAIIAGLVIILALAILYIGVGLWTMDPGRDSIIYRMTTTRMKKD